MTSRDASLSPAPEADPLAAMLQRASESAARANPRRSARNAKAKEPDPSPLLDAGKVAKDSASNDKKPVQAPRKRQKKEGTSLGKAAVPSDEEAALARAKATWAKTKGRRGHLKMVVEMPFDLVLEVFSFLEPADLLHLSMTTKSMRGLVMDKTLALPLWKAAFERVEPKPPACPEEVSLPQWANFLYGRTCFNCSATQGVQHVWNAVVRLCKNCQIKEFDQNIPWPSDKASADHHLREMVPHKWLKRPGAYGSQTWFYRPVYERQKAMIESLRSDPVKLDEYLKQEKLKQRKLSELQWGAEGGSNWERRLKTVKAVELDTRRSNREQAIMQRLDALGYTELLRRLPARSRPTLPGFGGVKPLTDKGLTYTLLFHESFLTARSEWEKLQPLLVDTLEELQKTFKNEDWKKMINSRTNAMYWVFMYYISQNRDREPFAPQRRSLALVEPFRTMIYDTPADKELQQKDFLEHLEDMPRILDSWREEAEGVLLGLLPQSLETASKGKKGKAKETAPDRPVLSLGITLFSCKWCPDILTYPAVLSHGCLYRSAANNRVIKEGGEADNGEEEEEEGVADPNVRWNEGHNQVEFDEAASAYASAVIKALGEDPKTATWEDLDKANKRVECLRCRKDKGLKRLVMNWRAAVLHEFDKHGEDDDDTPDGKWEALDEESLAVAHAKEKSMKNNSDVRPDADTLRCCQCEALDLEDGKVNYARWTAPIRGTTVCSKGHDLTADGASFNTAWNIPFKSTPHPVKIA
ncbi:hypothetical protein NMY22_g2323 [Coprinellus aureogranulatus]|nr:hypothetical protein NMY22_g2323 [Coprinellus aureogranulatus]